MLYVKDVMFLRTIVGISAFSVLHEGGNRRMLLDIYNIVASQQNGLFINIDTVVAEHFPCPDNSCSFYLRADKIYEINRARHYFASSPLKQ